MAHVDNLRRHFPSLRHVTYLNTGTCGPIPDVAVEKMQSVLIQQLQEGRLRENYFGALGKVKQEVREQLAVLFEAGADNFALTGSTTQAVNIVVWGLPLQAGDEIVFTDDLHPSALVPLALLKQRKDVVLRCVSASGTSDDILSAYRHAMTSKTRLVVSTQVSYQTGVRMPVEAIAKVAREAGAWCLVDGAQGAGAEFLSLGKSHIDFYAFPGQKWLCGPDGTGGLYIRTGLLSVLDMTYAGMASLRDELSYNPSGTFLPAESARRYEYEKADLLNWSGFLETLKFMRVQVGWEYVFTRIQGLSGQLMDQLLDISHVNLFTPRDARAGIISFHLDHVDARVFVEAAKERNIDVRLVPEQNLVRVSTGFYNSEDEIQRLVNVVASMK